MMGNTDGESLSRGSGARFTLLAGLSNGSMAAVDPSSDALAARLRYRVAVATLGQRALESADLEVRTEETDAGIETGPTSSCRWRPRPASAAVPEPAGFRDYLFGRTNPTYIRIRRVRWSEMEGFSPRSGIGIDPRETDRLFRVFDRLHGREEHVGTGGDSRSVGTSPSATMARSPSTRRRAGEQRSPSRYPPHRTMT